jgi:hypothetical protein
MKVEWDEWDGVVCCERTAEDCSADDADAVLRLLDQSKHTLMTVRGGVRSLTIGGGVGRYVVFSQENDDGEIWEARTRRDVVSGGERVMVVAGGQEGDFSPDQVLTHDEARLVLQEFFTAASRSNTVDWVVV